MLHFVVEVVEFMLRQLVWWQMSELCCLLRWVGTVGMNLKITRQIHCLHSGIKVKGQWYPDRNTDHSRLVNLLGEEVRSNDQIE